ncbi:MAG: efflux RND transporter periplasmic adaptor subunit [Desulfobaccales bacterium]
MAVTQRIEKLKRLDKRLLLIGLGGLIAVLLLLGYLLHGGGRSTGFSTVQVKRGDLVAAIGATGTVEPEQVVDVGAQVAGIILAFGQDEHGNPVDYGSVVSKGAVLAHIDDTLYVAAVEIDKASLQQARANLVNAKANVLQMKAKLWEAEVDWHRAQKLGPSQALAPTTYDQYKANYEVAKANLAVAEAAVAQAAAAVAQAAATLKKDEETLAYCTVKSPVAGVIVDRRVNIGQTIVSTTTTPSLFLIAKDLKRIQVWASVNEADIGNIHPGQPVTFTVDAFGDQVFHGIVAKIRLNATMSQNVVTYTVEVNCDNSDGKLLPYLTTNLQFEVGRRQKVLMVPNASLRFAPRSSQIAFESGEAPESAPAASRNEEEHITRSGASASRGTIWVAQGDRVRPIAVHVGLTDGVWTEVSGKGITEGLRVVTAEGKRETPGSQSTGASPFIPQMGRFRGGQGQPPPGGGR